MTKDPTFAPAAARELFALDMEFPFSRLAVHEAARMPAHAAGRLAGLLGGSVAGRRILMCGVSYRQDVGDTRYSPSETLYRALIGQGAKVSLHDPYVDWWEELELAVPGELPASDGLDAVVFTIPHEHYRELDLGRWVEDKARTLVFDAFMVFGPAQRRRFRQQGVRIEAIGVADGL